MVKKAKFSIMLGENKMLLSTLDNVPSFKLIGSVYSAWLINEAHSSDFQTAG